MVGRTRAYFSPTQPSVVRTQDPHGRNSVRASSFLPHILHLLRFISDKYTALGNLAALVVSPQMVHCDAATERQYASRSKPPVPLNNTATTNIVEHHVSALLSKPTATKARNTQFYSNRKDSAVWSKYKDKKQGFVNPSQYYGGLSLLSFYNNNIRIRLNAPTHTPDDVEHAVGRRSKAHAATRGGGRASGGELRPRVSGRIEAVEVVEAICGGQGVVFTHPRKHAPAHKDRARGENSSATARRL